MFTSLPLYHFIFIIQLADQIEEQNNELYQGKQQFINEQFFVK